jgi:hypothetical protein
MEAIAYRNRDHKNQTPVSEDFPLPVAEGFAIPSYDNIALGYDVNNNLTSVQYKVGSTIVATLALTYDGSNNLISVVKS